MMIVKTPLKERNVQPNRRKAPSARNSENGNGNGHVRDFSKFTTHGNGKSTVYGKRKKKPSAKKISFPDISAWKVILGAIIIGAFGVLYLNHVFATQKLLQEVQQLEREYNQAKLRHDDYRLTYERMIGPKEIYENAKEQGFINGGPADKVITVEEE